MPRNPAVITGLGIVSAIGIGADAFFESLMQRRSAVRSLAERTDGAAKPQQDELGEADGIWIGAPILDFEPKLYVKPRKAMKVMCREIQTAFAASQLAIEDAGLAECLPAKDDGVVQPADVATIFGAEMYYGPPIEMVDPVSDCLNEDGTVSVGKFGAAARKGVMPLWMLKYLPNMPACHVGISVNAHGPNNTLVLGDVSGPAALMESQSCIDRGIAKVAITGAAGTRIDTTRMNYRNDLPIASISDPLEWSSRPHDSLSKGVVGGEGAVTLILEEAQYAMRRGAQSIARVAGAASRFVASDGIRVGPRSAQNDVKGARGSKAAIQVAIEAALRSAEIKSSDLGLVVSHAAGDPLIDEAERQAIVATGLSLTPMITPAVLIGHCGSAAAEFGLAIGAMCIRHKQIPPAVHHAVAHEDIHLCQEARSLEKNYVLCISHTSEGNAIAVILAPPE